MNKLRNQISAFGKMVDLQIPSLPTTANALHTARDVDDLRRAAQRRVPRFVFDYVAGGAYHEESISANHESFTRRRLVPRTLRPVAEVDTSVEFLGQRFGLPIGLAPTGLTGLSHPDGEIAVARAAARFDVPMTLSTMATRSIEDVAKAAPDACKWFQLYLRTDRTKSLDLIHRALANGYDTLMLTVDTPVAGRRMRDERNGLSLPPQLRADTFLDVARHPRWGVNFLSHEVPHLANFEESTASISELVNDMFDPRLSMKDLAWLREIWPHKLIVKGILGTEDAVTAFDHGVDAVCVSNHGGRQLDRTVSPLDALERIRKAVGPDRPLILDSGITSGLDVVTALATGADFVLVGRAFLYGLMVGGQAGVERTLEILAAETKNVLQLMGATRPGDLGPQLTHLEPSKQEVAL